MAEPQVDQGASTSTAGAPAPPNSGAAPAVSEFEPQGFRGSTTGERIGRTEPEAESEVTPEEDAADEPKDRPVVGRGGEIPAERVSDRVARARRAERSTLLKEVYGTDDPKEVDRIKAERTTQAEELKKFTTERAKRERSEMTELTRAKTDLAAVREANKKLEEQIKESRISVSYQKQDAVIMREAAAHIDPKYQKYARSDLTEYVRGLDKDEQAVFDDRKLARWFVRYARENPLFALKQEEKAATPSSAPVKTPPRRRAITAPKSPQSEKPTVNDGLAGKTPRPGQPNSMSATELRQYMKEHKIKHW